MMQPQQPPQDRLIWWDKNRDILSDADPEHALDAHGRDFDQCPIAHLIGHREHAQDGPGERRARAELAETVGENDRGLARPAERVDDRGIEVRSRRALHFGHRIGNGHRVLVRPRMRHGVERIGHSYDARLNRNLLAPQPVGKAGPIEPLVM